MEHQWVHQVGPSVYGVFFNKPKFLHWTSFFGWSVPSFYEIWNHLWIMLYRSAQCCKYNNIRGSYPTLSLPFKHILISVLQEITPGWH